MRVPLTLMTLVMAGRSARELIILSFVSMRADGPVVFSSHRSGLCGPRACRGAARAPGSAAAVSQGTDAFAGLQRVGPTHQKATNQCGEILVLVLVSCGLCLFFFGNVKLVALIQSRFYPLHYFFFSVCQCMPTLGREKCVLFDKTCAQDAFLEII